MSEDVIMWVIGGCVAMVTGLLYLIWDELRSLRGDMKEIASSSTRHDVELTFIKTAFEKLPCQNNYPCPEKESKE